jgi:hypothetical protein
MRAMVLPRPYNDEDLVRIGKAAENATGLPLNPPKDEVEAMREDNFPVELFFGQSVCSLIARAERIIELKSEPPISERLRSLRSLLKKIWIVRREYRRLSKTWTAPMDPPNYRNYGVGHAYGFGMIARRDHIQNEERRQLHIDLMVYFLVDQIREAQSLQSEYRGFSRFVSSYIANDFEYFFGQRPGYTYSDLDGVYEGPFLRFARYILEQAKADVTDAAICQALARSRRMQASDKV